MLRTFFELTSVSREFDISNYRHAHTHKTHAHCFKKLKAKRYAEKVILKF